MDSNVTNVGGENWLHLEIDSAKQGVELLVRAHPLVEEFFNQHSGGTCVSPDGIGPHWYSPTKDELSVYRLTESLDDGGHYTLMVPGYTFSYDGLVNLSFLRLKGISVGEGVRFGVRSPMSFTGRKQLQSDIGKSMRLFCRDFLVKTRLILDVVSREE